VIGRGGQVFIIIFINLKEVIKVWQLITSGGYFSELQYLLLIYCSVTNITYYGDESLYFFFK